MNKKLIEFIQEDCSEAANLSLGSLGELKNQKIFIAGGTGFMGSWIAEFISYLNDNYNFNTSLLLAARNIEIFVEEKKHLASRKKIEIISKDIRNINELPDDITFIIHAAASPDNRVHVSNPIDCISVITHGTGNLIDKSFNLSYLKNFLYLSSGQVYGKKSKETEMISENKFGPLDCNSITNIYAEAKRLAEATCCAYFSQYKLPITIARPFSFIGPYQSLTKPWAINNFINDAFNSKTIRIIGNGEPVRTYMYPVDMVVWLLKIMLNGKPSKAYNVGSPYGISLKSLAEKIVSVTHSNAKIELKFTNEDNSKYIPDLNLGFSELGLNIAYDADKTIERAVNWFKLYLHNE